MPFIKTVFLNYPKNPYLYASIGQELPLACRRRHTDNIKL